MENGTRIRKAYLVFGVGPKKSKICEVGGEPQFLNPQSIVTFKSTALAVRIN